MTICFVVENYTLSHFFTSIYSSYICEIGDIDIRVSAIIFEFMTREDKQLLERTMNSQFAVVWKWTYPPLKMLSHYTTSGLSSLTGRKGIGNLVFGPSPYRAASDLKTSILHFPEQWVGRTPPICPELGRWMDRSHVGEQGRRNGIRPRQRKRERERGKEKGSGRERIDVRAGVDC